MRLFQKKRRREQINIFHAEDRARRALAQGNVTAEDAMILLDLARKRRKPRDLILVHRRLQAAGNTELFDQQELDTAIARDEARRKEWAERAASPVRIALFHVRDWHARLCEGVAKLAGDELVLQTCDEDELVAARPDAVISSYIPPDAVARMRARLPDSFWLYLRHGVANKRASFGIAGAFDAVCVSSRYVADSYTEAGFFPKEDVWVTGYPPLDDLARRREKSGNGAFTVLYAPTFTRDLSSANIWGPGLAGQILKADSSLRLIVKLHPQTREFDRDIWDQWGRACLRSERTRFVEDSNADLLSFFPETDLLLSDFSSSAFLFLTTGRPIVLLTPAGAAEDHGWRDPDGIEWKWRDMAVEVRHLWAAGRAVRRILRGTDHKAEIRETYRKLLFDDTLDGNSAARVMQRLGQVFGRGPG